MGMEGFSAAVPVISSADVPQTVSFLEKTLGFELQWIWGEPPVYAGLKAGRALLYVTHDPDMATAIRERNLRPDIFLWITGIANVYEQHRTNGVEIVEQLSQRPWGIRQYVIREPNGYHIKIAELTEGARPAECEQDEGVSSSAA